MCYTIASHQLSITHLVVHTDQPQGGSRNWRLKIGSGRAKRRHLVQSSMRVEIMHLVDCWSRVLSLSGYINSPGILWQITSNWWVKATDIYLLMVLEARSLKPRCRLLPCREILYQLSHQGSPRPCSLSILHIVVCICYYQNPNLSPFPSLAKSQTQLSNFTFFLSFPPPLVTINLFPMFLLSHPWWYLLKHRIFYFLWSSIYFSLVAWTISKKSVPNQRSVRRVLCVCLC